MKNLLGWLCYKAVMQMDSTKYPLGSRRWRIWLWLLSWAGDYSALPYNTGDKPPAESRSA